MKPIVWIALVVVGLASTGQPSAPDLNALVEAERAFARLSAAEGTRTAFLTFLADGAIVFEPGPVDGRAVHRARPTTDDRLAWQPAIAGIARSGELGYTSGPWRFRPVGTSGDGDVYGHYVSVWRVQPEHGWRVVADIGVTHESPPGGLGVGEAVAPEPFGDERQFEAGSQDELVTLLAVDRAVIDAGNLGRAYAAALDEPSWLYRPGLEPMRRAAGLAHVASDAAPWIRSPAGGAVAASGDLAYTYGTATREAEPHAYVRIWRWRRAGWRVAIDVTVPAGEPGM